MPRSKDFSKRQKDKKKELLKKYGCYILKNIKGDITINNPENYRLVYIKNASKNAETIGESMTYLLSKRTDFIETIAEHEETIKNITFNASNEIEGNNDNTEKLLIIIKNYKKILHRLTKLQEYGNPIQKLLLKILKL